MHHGRDGIHELLRQARMVLEPVTHDEGAVEARAAILRRNEPFERKPSVRSPGTASAGAVAPAPYPTETAQADHELDLVCALVLNAPEAAASLEALAADHRADPEGALVFAALLHVAGRHHAARFWWQFAAGGGSSTAAYCLHLEHQRRGEFQDAAHWHSQATRHPDPESRPARAWQPERPLLPDSVCHNLLAQSYDGASPSLPGAVEAAINSLRSYELDEYGDVPQPTVEFAHDLEQVS